MHLNFSAIPKIQIIALTCFSFFLILFANLLSEPFGWHAQGKLGLVAAGEQGSVAAGLNILEQGGNAADAASAVILALSITDYGSFCIGGEVPLLYYDAQKETVKVLSGQGGAPLDSGAIRWYFDYGIPPDEIKAAAVPAVIDLCVTLLKMSGTQTFETVVAPTLAILASDNASWYSNLANTLNKLVEAEQNHSGSRLQKLQAVADRFYRGDIADSLVQWYRRSGGFLTKRDLAQHQTWIEEPVSIQYKNYKIYKCNTWTQGPVLLQALRLLEGFDLKQMGYLSADYIHVVTEALKLALADRDAYYGDPRFVDVPLDRLLSDQYTQLRRPLINLNHASNRCQPGDPIHMQAVKTISHYLPADGGTTTCCVVDRWGNIVAATPSGWGSSAGPGGNTGVTHGTRLRSLNTTPGHPNAIAPGKRPRITLTPTLVFKNNKPFLAISVEGGDVQDQTTLNLLLKIIEFQMSPFEAVAKPRFATTLHEDSFNPLPNRERTIEPERFLRVNQGIPLESLTHLEQKGHLIRLEDGAIGSPVVIQIDAANNMAVGASDPKIRHFVGALSGRP